MSRLPQLKTVIEHVDNIFDESDLVPDPGPDWSRRIEALSEASLAIVRWQALKKELTILVRLHRHSRSFDDLGHHAVNAARARDEQLKKVQEMAEKI